MIAEIVSITPQIDGRSYVRERHTDQFGIAHEIEYLADAGVDHGAAMATHAETLAEELKQAELASWLATVRQGNPIPVDGCRYCSRMEAFAYCFQSLVFDADSAALYKAAWMVPLFSDDELLAMGFTGNQVAEIRARVATLEQARKLLESVTPLEAE